MEISQSACLDMMRQAVQFGPGEICGLIVIDEHGEQRAHHIPNVATNNTKEFQLSPQAARYVADRFEIIGMYHSHPGGRHDPSKADWEFKPPAYLDWEYLIVAVGKGVYSWKEVGDGRRICRWREALAW